MKKTIKVKAILRIAGIIALVAVIGFSIVACDDDDDSGSTGGGGTGGGGSASVKGTFTLTDIPSQYNGKYAQVQCRTNSSDLMWKVIGCESAGKSGFNLDPLLISNGRVTIPLWIDTLTQTGAVGYTGNDTLYCSVNIFSTKSFDSTKVITYASRFSVTFSNGSATRSWNDLTWNNR